MIGYVILLAFWVLATLTLFALSIPYIRKRNTKIVVSVLVAMLSVGMYTLYAQSLERTWWAWLLVVIGLAGSASLSVLIEQRKVEQEVPQRMVN